MQCLLRSLSLCYRHCFSLQFTQPSPLQNLPCSGSPGPCNLAGRASPPALGRSAPCCPERGAPSEAQAPGELGRSGGRRHCGLPATAPRPRDARTGCRAPPAAACRAFPSFGDLHKGCDSAGKRGGELQRPAVVAVITPMPLRPGHACSC